MKTLTLTILSTFFLFSNLSFAQDVETNQENIFSRETDDEGYFSIATGYTANLKFINNKGLDNLTEHFSFPKISNPIFSNGFELKTSTVIIKNLNIGFIKSSTNVIQRNDSTLTGNILFLNKQLSLNCDNIGFMLDYAINPFKSFSVNPGINITFSDMEINITEAYPFVNYNDIGPAALDIAYYHSLSKSFIVIEPKISVEYAITNFLMFRTTASYSIGIDNFITNKDWTYNSISNINNTPSELSPSGLNIQLGLFVGLMNF